MVIAAVGLSIYCLFDVRGSGAHLVRGLPKPAWFVVVLVPIAGPLAWFAAGRPMRPGSGPTGPPRVVGPDDDPDFLWEIEKRRRRPPGDT